MSTTMASKPLQLPVMPEHFMQRLMALHGPLSSCDVTSMKLRVLADSIGSKCYYTPDQAELCREAAIQKTLDMEAHCKRVNLRMFRRNAKVKKYVSLVAHRIEQILGHHSASLDREPVEHPSECESLLDFLCWQSSWGTGATTRLKRKYADPAYKFSGRPHGTAGVLRIHRLIAPRFTPRWQPDGVLHEVGRWDSVPKNSEIDRGILIEPCLNLYYQKGAGQYLLSRLNGRQIWPGHPEWQLDLASQEVNRTLAQLGSLDGSIATIDLSSASDTIALIVAYLLLPQWLFEVLEALRTPAMEMPDGSIVKLEKLSSMGNGFTWEIQSLIFLACGEVARSLSGADGPVATYGDDIIVPSAATGILFDILESFGFIPNAKKSFYEGFFRESCGKHFYHGYDVSPFYFRTPLEVDDDVYRLHNRFISWMARDGFLDARLEPLVEELKALVPRGMLVPFEYSDGGFYSNLPAKLKGKARLRFKHKVLKACDFEVRDYIILTSVCYKMETKVQSDTSLYERYETRNMKILLRRAVSWGHGVGDEGRPANTVLTGVTHMRVCKSTVLQWDGLPPYC